jgi:biopolymer transport protein ExbD
MRRMRVPGYHLPITKVNVVPIIDVSLVLVIILLVTAPLMSVADLPVDLPQARSRDSEDERNISITLSSTGALAVDDEVVTTDGLPAVLQTHLAKAGDKDVLVVVRADSGAPYTEVQKLLEEARDAGATHLAIATRQKTEATR